MNEPKPAYVAQLC